MRLKYRVMSFPNFPWGIYTEERNLGWGLPHMLGLRNHYDFLKDRSCRYAVMVLLLRNQARWRLSHKLELNKEIDHHLDLEELWLCLPSVQHQGSHHLWPTPFHLPPTSTCIPTPLSKLQTCTFNSQLLLHNQCLLYIWESQMLKYNTPSSSLSASHITLCFSPLGAEPGTISS